VPRRRKSREVPGAVVPPDDQIERADAGHDVDVAVVVDVAGGDAHELIAGFPIDAGRESGR
jgi:hypothetical protein